MTDQSPLQPEMPPDDEGRDDVIKDEKGRHRTLKFLLLALLAYCLVMVMVRRDIELVEWRGDPSLPMTADRMYSAYIVSAGWPFDYTKPYQPIAFNTFFYLDIAIALVLLLYFWHALTVIFRNWPPKYQYSLRTLLGVPVLLAVVMILFHYEVLTWRRFFLVPIYGAGVICLICFIYEVRPFVTTRKGTDA